MPISLNLTERVALVTGGAKGVGAGITRRLLDAGATVITCGRREVDPVKGSTHRTCDVRDPESVKALIDGIVAEHGRLDILVNNAGGSPWGLASEMGFARQAKIIELNLTSPMLVSLEANRVMQQHGGGSIISISSVSGVRLSPGTSAYGAAKAGLDHLTRSLAVEWGPKVRINTIDLGMTRTHGLEEFYGADGAAELERLEGTVPLARLTDPTDVGDLVTFLASPLAKHISGACIELHGGGEAGDFLNEQRRLNEQRKKENNL